MSIRALNRAWDSTASAVKKLLLIALADMADEWGYCYPSVWLLAKRCNVSERTVYRTINELIELGEIRVYQSGGGRGSSNVYQVIIGMSAEDILQSERLSEIARNTTSDKIDTHSKNPDKLSPFSKGCDAPNISSENPDNLSPFLENPDNLSGFTAKNPDNLSPKPLINAAVNINNIKLTAAALINGYPDNLSGFTEQNPDNLSPFLENPDNLSGFAKKPDDASPLPEEVKNSLEMFGWRGSLADVEKAWRSDPERVRQWLWYARKHGWSGALLRTVLRNDGEYPPELDPSSDQSRRRYVEGPYAEFIEH